MSRAKGRILRASPEVKEGCTGPELVLWRSGGRSWFCTKRRSAHNAPAGSAGLEAAGCMHGRDLLWAGSEIYKPLAVEIVNGWTVCLHSQCERRKENVWWVWVPCSHPVNTYLCTKLCSGTWGPHKAHSDHWTLALWLCEAGSTCSCHALWLSRRWSAWIAIYAFQATFSGTAHFPEILSASTKHLLKPKIWALKVLSQNSVSWQIWSRYYQSIGIIFLYRVWCMHQSVLWWLLSPMCDWQSHPQVRHIHALAMLQIQAADSCLVLHRWSQNLIHSAY